MTPEDRERVEVEVVHRVMERLGRHPASIERALFDTLYEERRRLETDPAASPPPTDQPARGARRDGGRPVTGVLR